MKKLFLILSVLLIWTTAAAGQDSAGQEAGSGNISGPDTARIVGVSDFENYSGDQRFNFMQKGISDAVINQLLSLDGLMVVERQKFETIMKELQLGQSGLMNDMTVQKVGRSLSAGLMIVGGFEYNPLSRQIRVNARVVEIETGLIVYSDTVIDDESLADDLQKAIAEKIRTWFMRKFGLALNRSEPAPAVGDAAESSGFGSLATEEHLKTETAAEVPEPVILTNAGAEVEVPSDAPPRPASFIELIRLLFTDLREFPASGASRKNAGLPGMIDTIEKPLQYEPDTGPEKSGDSPQSGGEQDDRTDSRSRFK